LDDTLSLAVRYAEGAKAALADPTSNSWRPALEDLADFAVMRRA
jgi:octaprenyl-diphosphate synthase